MKNPLFSKFKNLVKGRKSDILITYILFSLFIRTKSFRERNLQWSSRFVIGIRGYRLNDFFFFLPLFYFLFLICPSSKEQIMTTKDITTNGRRETLTLRRNYFHTNLVSVPFTKTHFKVKHHRRQDLYHDLVSYSSRGREV